MFARCFYALGLDRRIFSNYPLELEIDFESTSLQLTPTSYCGFSCDLPELPLIVSITMPSYGKLRFLQWLFIAE
jgi:hypothetical protein